MTEHGWCHLVAIIDTYDRTIVGWRLSDSGSAVVATGAVEDAFRARGIDPDNNDLTIRSDNGLIFGSKAFTGVARRYNVSQRVHHAPYTPEQNGMIERFFRTAKEEVFWQHRIHDPDEAFARFAAWIEWYDEGRPHSALGYLSSLRVSGGNKQHSGPAFRGTLQSLRRKEGAGSQAL
jgi:putative transposase